MKRSRSLYLLSPAALVVFSWLLTALAVLVGYLFQDNMLVMSRTMFLNRIDFHFPLAGMVWIAISLLVFSIFGFATTRPIARTSQVIDHPSDLSQALRLAAIVHVFIILVVIAWVATGAARLGGLDRLIAMAAENETYEAREVILDNKLLPGMRLLYSACDQPLACKALACLRLNHPGAKNVAGTTWPIGLGMFLVSAVALFLPADHTCPQKSFWFTWS